MIHQKLTITKTEMVHRTKILVIYLVIYKICVHDFLVDTGV